MKHKMRKIDIYSGQDSQSWSRTRPFSGSWNLGCKSWSWFNSINASISVFSNRSSKN